MTERTRGIFISVAAMTILAALCIVYWLFDPSDTSWMPRCLWKTVTGTDCPGCGSQRMAYALIHGDFSAAWHANAFALCSIPLILLLLLLEIRRSSYPRLYRAIHRPLFIYLLLDAILLWWLLRNIL